MMVRIIWKVLLVAACGVNANLFQGHPSGGLTPADPKTFVESVQNIMKSSPNGNIPPYDPTLPTIEESVITAIHFYAVGPQDNFGTGSQGCHGGGSQGDIVIPEADFTNPKLCPSGNGGDGLNDDLEGNAASFMIDGTLGNCHLNFYSQPGCKDADWVGYMNGYMQETCNAPRDVNGELIKSLRSFNYICPDI